MSLNGGVNAYYDLNPPTTTGNPDLNGGNLGVFAQGSSNLVLKGAQLKTFKNGNDDVTGTRLRYRVYAYTGTPGAFNVTPDLGFAANESGSCNAPYSSCNQRWETNNLNVDLLNTLTPGNYVLEVYGESSNSLAGTLFLNNGGNNFRAQFTVGSSLINESFESGYGSFTQVNDISANKWQQGTAAGATAGSNAVYISNSASSPFAHNYTATNSTTHLYQDVVVPAGQDVISLSFSWRNNGESSDYLRVSYAPITFLPSATTTSISSSTALPGTGTGSATTLLNSLFGQNTFVTATTTLPASLAGTTVRLIFTWTNNSFTQNQGPAALDNVVMTSRAAQPLSGTYTIDNTANLSLGNRTFPSFTSAAQALTQDGMSGAVTFNVISGQIFSEAPVALGVISGNSSTNTITFQRSAGTNATLRSGLGTGSTDAVFSLNGTDYVTFNGINLVDNGSDATTRMERGLAINAPTGTDGSNTIAFRNAYITLSASNTNTTTGVYTFAGATAAGGINQNLTFQDVVIMGALQGYNLNGTSAFPDNNVTITGTATLPATLTSYVIGQAGASAAAYGVSLANVTNLTVSNTVFSQILSSGSTAYGITSTSGTGNTMTISGNTFSNIGVTNNSVATGINITSGASASITGNSFSNLTNTGTNSSAALYGIFMSAGVGTITGNSFSNFNKSGAASTGAYAAIRYSAVASATNTIARNTITGLTTNTTAGIVSGIYLEGSTSASAVVNMSNNMLSNITANASNGVPSVRALDLRGGGTINVYFNTVYLNGMTATSTSHQSAALTWNGSIGTIDYRNNILVNKTVLNGAPSTTNRAMAIYRTSSSAGTLAAGSVINNNLLFGTTTIYAEASTNYSTLITYRSQLGSGRESAAVTESNTPFVSNSDPHLNTANATQAEAGGQNNTGIVDDIDALNTRVAASYPKGGQTNGGGQNPDIGADEGDFIPADLTPPTITITSTVPDQTSTAAPTITATITDNSGVNTTAGTKPRLYYRLSTNANTFAGNTSADDGWKFVEATNASSPFSFTPDFSLLTSTPVAGSVIQYFVTAQDLSTTQINVGISPNNTFAATPATVALTSAAFPITATFSVANKNQYTILFAFSGTVNVGPGETYTSFTAANGLFSRLNAGALTGNLTVLVTGDISIEDGANRLNALTEEPTGSNFIIRVQPSAAATRTITGASNTIATNGFVLNGADRVVFDGRFNQTGTDRFLTFRNASTSVPVFTLIQDATNNTIRNCVIEGASTSASNGVVFLGTSTTSPVGGVVGGVTGNDNFQLLNNQIRDITTGTGLPFQAFYSSGSLSAANSDVTIQGNEIFNWTGFGVLLSSSTGSNWLIDDNDFFYNAAVVHSAGTPRAIEVGGLSSSLNFDVTNNTIGGNAAGATGTWTWSTTGTVTFYPILVNATGPSSGNPGNVTVSGNLIRGFAIASSSTSTFQAIRSAGSTTEIVINNNTISNIAGVLRSGNGPDNPALGGIVSNSEPNSIEISGNSITGLNNTHTGTLGRITGIVHLGTNANTVVINRNRIGDVRSSTGSGIPGQVTGIYIFAGIPEIRNNQISIENTGNTNAMPIIGIWEDSDASSDGQNYQFNSVRIGGSATAGSSESAALRRGTTATLDLRNNILINERTGGTGKHIALKITSTTDLTSDYNDLYAANPTTTVEVSAANTTFAAWQATAGTTDDNSKNVDARFVDEAAGNLNLDPTTNCQLDGAAQVIVGVNGEYENAATSRQTSPDIGSDEFSYTQQTATLTTTGAQCAPFTGSVTITGNGGPWSIVLSENGVNQAPVTATTSPFTFPTTGGVTYALVSVNDAYGPTATTGCALTVSGGPLTVNTPATVNAGPATATICASDTYSLAGTIGGGATGGTWSTSGDGSFSPSTTDLNAIYTPGTNDVATGSATLTLTSSGQVAPCTAATDVLALTINPQPTFSLSSTDPLCFGGQGTITITAAGGPGSNYRYSVNGGAYSGVFSTSVTISRVSGTYSILVKNDASDCVAASSQSVTLTSPTALGLGGVSKTNLTCTGANDGTISVTASGGTPPYVFDYSLDGGAYTGASMPQMSGTYVFSSLVAGTYIVRVTDANGCSPVTASATRVIVDPGALTVTNTTTVEACSGSSNGSITLTVTGGTQPYVYDYSFNGGAFQSATSPTNLSSHTFTGLAAGNYVVRVSDANGCTPGTAPVTLTEVSTVTFTGAFNTTWYNALNWSPECVPSATTDAIVPNGMTVVINGGTANVRNLDIQGSSTVTLSGDLNVYGAFTVSATTSYVATGGTTTFTGTGAQPIPAGTYRNLVVVGATPKVLTGGVNVTRELDLTGGSVDLGAYNLAMTDPGTTAATLSFITGADASHYVITSGLGRLFFLRTGGATGARGTVFFPIGTATSYTPAVLKNFTGTTSNDAASALVTNALLGTPAGYTVNKQWDVTWGGGALPSGETASLELQWNATDEAPNFDRTMCTVVHFEGGDWNARVRDYGPATLVDGRWSRTRNQLATFSPFAVQDIEQTLPVELTRFEAVRQGRDARLTWTTASEQNSRGFDVQTSLDGRSWRSLGFVSSTTPNATTVREYSFTDVEKNKTGLRFYRLVQEDLDGTRTASPARTVQFEGTITTSVTALPNPFGKNGALRVELVAGAAGSASLLITDALGRTVHTEAVNVVAGLNSVQPGVSAALPAGSYTLTTVVDGQRFHSRLVKE